MNVDKYLPRPVFILIVILLGHFVKGWNVNQFLPPQILELCSCFLYKRMTVLTHRDKYQLPPQ